MNGAIVVGYDGSPQAQQALAWAAQEARRERRALRLVHVGEGDGQSLDAAVERVRSEAPGVEVTADVEADRSVPRALIRLSSDAHLLVVGSRGRGGFEGLLLGSVSSAVAAHAHCPVVVVRQVPDASSTSGVRPVVVGVDGSPTSVRAIDLAFDQASWRNAPLVAVHAWDLPAMMGPVPPWTLEEVEQLLVTEKAVVAESLAGHADRYPDVKVETVVQLGAPAPVVLDAASDAQLLVVGSRGRGGFGGLLLGSVSQVVVSHASCPVVVVQPSVG
ncbi:universal stress protein [Cellulomonas fengjieae]|uniref:Universal stress protein n=1 Tax=Cellulomonas fengjieae TaxID=2819978 RepID=A0ABS3SIV3_9CELL|nr:universal stress protein [Cellulomonas fengjieae]MBO3085675.1 universal stress protein [Cellulomonas fengjieae]QVI67610.1 universal stress protein [Cellulomonas fengjieae]